MNYEALETMAASLYDGGWRDNDEDELKKEYDLTDDEAKKICEFLSKYKNRKVAGLW